MNKELMSIKERMLTNHEYGLDDLKRNGMLPRSSYYCAEVGCLYLDAVSKLRENKDKKIKERLKNFYKACVKSNTIKDCKKALQYLNIFLLI